MSTATQPIRIKAVCSVPRLGFNDHFSSIYDALMPRKIPLGWYSGAFWEKSIQCALEDSVEQVDWVLTLDYDSLITPAHIDRMIDIFARNPHIDALAANQPRRGNGMPLMTIKGKDGKPVGGRIEYHSPDGDIRKTIAPLQVYTAHFGCTLLRMSAFKDLPKPWFFSTPTEQGEWRGDGVRDADIYFWVKWADYKKTLYLAPDVCIGHLEAMVSIFESEEDENGELALVQKYISSGEWRERYSVTHKTIDSETSRV